MRVEPAEDTPRSQSAEPTIERAAPGTPSGDVERPAEDDRAILAETRDFLSLAGSVVVPTTERHAAWDDVIRRTRSARATRQR